MSLQASLCEFSITVQASDTKAKIWVGVSVIIFSILVPFLLWVRRGEMELSRSPLVERLRVVASFGIQSPDAMRQQICRGHGMTGQKQQDCNYRDECYLHGLLCVIKNWMPVYYPTNTAQNDVDRDRQVNEQEGGRR